jgi:hypothetical protein
VFNKFPKYHTKILFGVLNAKVSMDDVFNPTIENESLNEIFHDNGIRVVNVATSKDLTVRSKMFHTATSLIILEHLIMF